MDVMELMIAELERRAEQTSFTITRDIEQLLTKSANNNLPTCIPASVSELYKYDIHMKELLIQLGMLPRFLKAATQVHQDAESDANKVLSLRELCETLKTLPVGQRMMPEAESLLRIYLTIPSYDSNSRMNIFCSTEVEELPTGHDDPAALEQLADASRTQEQNRHIKPQESCHRVCEWKRQETTLLWAVLALSHSVLNCLK